jgi:hypothetical protein
MPFHGTQLQLVQGELLGKLSILVPEQRKGDMMHHSTQQQGK